MNKTSPVSVLLVEDNITLREELSDFLRAEGFTVKVAGDGLEMNNAIERGMPDILILDLNLPFEDGIDITKRIRACFKKKSAKVPNTEAVMGSHETQLV